LAPRKIPSCLWEFACPMGWWSIYQQYFSISTFIPSCCTKTGNQLILLRITTVSKISKYFELLLYPDSRGVTRLDGARGKNQVWRRHVRTWALPEAMYCTEESACDIFWDFSAPPAVIRRQGNCAPLPPSLRPWLYQYGWVATYTLCKCFTHTSCYK